jgi:stage II sporulation protein M
VAVSLVTLVFGLLPGIVPLLSIGLNGFVLGVVYSQVAEVLGHWKAALKIVPHGVLEIPVLLLAASCGLWLGLNTLRDRDRTHSGATGVCKGRPSDG